MRISTNYQFEFSSTAIQNAQQTEVALQQELSTGKSINQPSDNPYGLYQSLTMTSLKNALSQYNSNLTYAQQFLQESNNALTSVNSMASQAYQLAVEAANSTTSQDARQGMVAQVTQMQQQLVSLANTQGANGEYIFGGQKTQAAPFTVANNALTYNGDTNNINVEVGPSQAMAVNTQAGPMFTTLYNQLQTFSNDLSSGNVSALSSVDITNLQNSQTAVLQAQGTIGGNLQQVTTLTNSNTLRTNDLTSQISNLTDANIAEVATQYQSAQTVYQAAITMAAQVSSLSLASYLQTSGLG